MQILKDLTDKDLRKNLEYFVLYRNIFTHGKLRFLCIAPEGHIDKVYENKNDNLLYYDIEYGRVSTNEMYITYLDSKAKKVMIPFEKKLVESFIQVYEDALIFINKFREIKSPTSN